MSPTLRRAPLIARWALASRARQVASHDGSLAVARLASSAAASSHASTPLWWNSVATLSGSAHSPKASTTTTRAPAAAASETYAPRARDNHGVPRRTTQSARGGLLRTMASAAPIVPDTRQPDSGSASTGQPRRSPTARTRRDRADAGSSRPPPGCPGHRGAMVAARPVRPSPRSPAGLTLGPGPGGSGPGSPVRGSRNSRLRWTGPGPRVPCTASVKARTASGLQVDCCDDSGTPGDTAQRIAAAIEADLFDGLGRPGVVQLGWPVCRADDERHPGVVRLDHRRVEFGGRGAAGDTDDRRAAVTPSPAPVRRRPRSARRAARAPEGVRPTRGRGATSANRDRSRRRRHRAGPIRRPGWR